jgi:hypothetical protein
VSYRQAILTRDAAEAALRQYIEADITGDLTQAEGRIASAQSERERMIERLAWSSKMAAMGRLSDRAQIADRLSLDQADFELEQARTQFSVLRKYTSQKKIKELRSDVEKTRSAAETRRQQYEAERSGRRRLIGF